MTPFRLHLAAVLALNLSTAAAAQEVVPPPTPLADALAEQMRALAVDARDVRALIAAGELSVKLDDPAAALGFFGRAQAAAPGDPRVAAGKAGALVLLERPGEALRLYQQAERAGLAMRPYLAQRGLAYDLTGQPGHAQRDYRAALTAGRDDETVRRLALSLGASGRRDEAMALLDPLLRRSDRAAWRARACILAMNGEAADGERIATRMMPGGAALGPFLRRLQWLPLADRAFAVHFGEVVTNAARQNDARLAPAVAMLPPEPAPLPSVAAVPATARPLPERGRRASAQIAAVGRVPAIGPVASSVTPAPTTPPRITSATAEMTIITPPSRAFVAMPTPAPAPPAIQVAPRPTPPVGWAASADATPQVVAAPSPGPPAAAPEPVATAAAAPPPTSPPVVEPSPVAEPVARRRASALDAIIGDIAIPSEELEVRRTLPRVVPTLPKVDPGRVKPEVAKPEPRRARPDPARAEPARWWVQVAGGANQADLGKDWARLSARSGAAFRGRTAWTTPLRATNRLLAGPFKSQGEASAFVNALASNGASAFAWQSPAGQPIARLGGR